MIIIPRTNKGTKRHAPFLPIFFFHPDYTVGFGVTPNHALRLVGYTTGRDLHPALKNYVIVPSLYALKPFLSRHIF